MKMPDIIAQLQDGPLAGFPGIRATSAQKATFIAKIVEIVAYCVSHGYFYLMGGKAEDITVSPLDAKGVDCSGFFRYLIYHASLAAFGEGWLIPDGSATQCDFFGNLGFKSGNHADYIANGGDRDGIVRACFCKSEDGQAYGHVWIDINGVTYESHGGAGPSSRRWTSPVLERIIDAYYCLL